MRAVLIYLVLLHSMFFTDDSSAQLDADGNVVLSGQNPNYARTAYGPYNPYYP
ncbi:unnamed protein product, partial [Anisakis simplex]|uniref:Uncharacterized protein n=1 Tax=Anisakis simplex TaxID=6269 RepID=A0A0M3JI57_ANISI